MLCLALAVAARVQSLPGGSRPGDYVAWDRGGSQLAVSGGNALTLWDVSKGRPSQWFPASQAGPICFTRTNKPVWLESGRLHQGTQSIPLRGKTLFLDGRELVVDGEWRTLAGLQPVDPRVELTAHERVVAISPDFAVLEEAEHGRLVDRQTGRSARLEHVSEKVAISPDQGWLALVSDRDDQVEVRQLPSMQVKLQLNSHDGSISGLSWRPDSAQLAVGDLAGVKLWNLASGRLEHRLDRALSKGVSYSPDGRYLAQGLSSDASVCLWDVKTGQQRATLVSYGQEWVVWAPDGRFEASPQAEPYLLEVDPSKRTTGLLPLLLSAP